MRLADQDWVINAFADIDTTGFEFGFAGRVGGATWDVLIDNLEIEYSTYGMK